MIVVMRFVGSLAVACCGVICLLALPASAGAEFGEESGETYVPEECTLKEGDPGSYIVVFQDWVEDPATLAHEQVEKYGGKLGFVYKSPKGYSAKYLPSAAQAVQAEPTVRYVSVDHLIWIYYDPYGIEHWGSCPLAPPLGPVPPFSPTLSSTSPASPANDNSPEVVGSAEAGTTVKLYADSSCAGPPLAAGSALEFAGGITVSVPDDSTTAFYATATDSEGNASWCSTGLTYTEDSTPPAVSIDSGPSGPTDEAKPSFAFSAADGGAGFACSIDRGTPSFAPCTSPFQPAADLAAGAWTFRARATDEAGNSATATRDFTVTATVPASPGVPPAPLGEAPPHTKWRDHCARTPRPPSCRPALILLGRRSARLGHRSSLPVRVRCVRGQEGSQCSGRLLLLHGRRGHGRAGPRGHATRRHLRPMGSVDYAIASGRRVVLRVSLRPDRVRRALAGTGRLRVRVLVRSGGRYRAIGKLTIRA